VDTSVLCLAAVLVTPVPLFIWAIAAATGQRHRHTVVGATLFGGLIAGFAGVAGFMGWGEHIGWGGPDAGPLILLVVPVALWSAAVGAWLGFGIGKRIAQRPPSELPEDPEA
jgi:hypothetical protein